ncbi:amidase [Pusillimonas sp. ANT_WB101]|uniref:amidase n=1 Tax=Pusillimonas sp. ANT_WB101 TaxID=2597356 RepID=UPI0011F031ED|nr:amidase [Pusillimonas sp. ANT_WB101]KAA0889997.1 amidase [Pusillimonas sp. ANT_WB101]
MQKNEIVDWDAVTLSKRILSKDVSCVEVLGAFTQQIDRLNPIVNAIVNRQPQNELYSSAVKLDKMLQRGVALGPMHGFPQAPKDILPAKGMITSKGSPIFQKQVSTSDSAAFQRMREGGSIFVGRTNSPEYGLGGHTFNSLYGVTRNPFDISKSAGGSSGGAGVAVALNMLPVADGTDMMGSLRTPAAFNNIFGMRTSVGCVPHGPSDEVFFQQFSVSGPIARNVPDLALLLSVQAGYDSRLPLTRKQDNPRLFSSCLDHDFTNIKVAWLGDLEGRLPMDSGLMEVYQNALPYFSAVGCNVEAARLDFDVEELWNAWIDLRSFTIANNSVELYRSATTRGQLKPEAIWEIERGLKLSAERIFDASRTRTRFYRVLLSLFEQYEYLLLPTTQVFPFPTEVPWPDTIGGIAMDTYHRWMEAVVLATMGGLPSLSVPAGFNNAGLPVGLQLISSPQADFQVLQLGHAYDLASQFSKTRSPLFNSLIPASSPSPHDSKGTQ